MSSIQSTGWNEYIIPPISAMGAIIFPYRLLVVKSALQLGKQVPQMSFFEGIKGGVRAAPTLGFTVGTQMIVQKAVEKWICGDGETPSFYKMFASSALVGLVSAPPLAAFNGQTMGRSTYESVRELNRKQTAAIVARETSFLFALRICNPLGERMKLYFGENKAVELASAFMSGSIGSLVGHPADTALTLWQRGIQIKDARQLMRGGAAKAVAIGIFAVCYKLIGDAFK